MAELAGGALLSAVFNVLLERLTPEQAAFLNFIRGKKLDNNLLHRLKPSLIAARAVLNDAELKQFTDPAVKEWLDELKDAAYDLEDLMDEISPRAATQNQVCDFSSASLNLHDTDMANKLEAVTDRLEFIVRQKDILDLKKSSGTETLSWRPQLTSRVRISDVCGREKEKEDIIKFLSDDDDDELSVIPIVGMGGVGKTTLVQLVYNDDNVKEKFDLRAWVCVSEAFDLWKIIQTIIKSISPDYVCDMMDLNLLQLHLEEKLARKKFLLVLDDVWNDKYTDWDTLKNLFHNGVEGSKILVTTRLERVALMVKTIPSFYRLDLLSNDDCLSVFAKHAFHSRDSIVNSCLEKIGRDIASKCKGLPLAAKVLGGLFRSKPDIKYWNSILKDDIWNSSEDEIIPALRVSYYYLPPHLKQCFVYCSLFPEDYQFDKEKLILMWMAEGFLQLSKRSMTLEEVGYEYFDDLISRSFFQPSSEIDGYFVMHDLIHELATCIGEGFYFKLEKDGNKISNRTRHLSCNFLIYPNLDHFESFKRAKALRTFIGLDFFYIPRSIGNAPHILLSNLKCLRMLSLCGLWALKTVPDSIGEFIHLRYLDLSETGIASLPDSLCKLYNLQTLKLTGCLALKVLPSDMQDLESLRYLSLSWTKIVSLPNSLCKLYNLQTLLLSGCDSLKMLPSDMQDLVNLRHLDIRGTDLKEMPTGLSKLKDLQFLSDFIVGKVQGTMIGELGEISNLKDKIKISKLENIKNGNEAFEGRMMEKKQIKNLKLSWSCDGYIEDSQTERDIMDKLQPHWDLERLTINGYRGTTFPDWLGSCSYHNMTSLTLYDCKNCWMLPPLVQLPALKSLHIGGFDMIVSIGSELFKGNDCASMIPFASLERLVLSNMTAWEEWHSIEMEAFPKLRILDISRCPKLIGNLPCELLSLETLEIRQCPLLTSCISRCPKLQDLEIYESQNVVLQEQELPPSLRKLRISGGRMLESVFGAHSENLHIQELDISDCSDTVSLPMNHFPPSIKHLTINNCESLNFVLISNTPLHNLQSISIHDCKYAKSLSDGMERLLPNLKRLRIADCPEMEALPEGILLSSLRELYIANCDKLLSRHAEWHLPSITYLQIGDCPASLNVKCFPEGCSLPSTLTTLELIGFLSLETLNCRGLQHLTSLKELQIMHSPKLEKMSGEMLPASLRKLQIWDCPLLEERYHKKDEEIWPKISHIPVINLSLL